MTRLSRAILRELNRGGQCISFNRVMTIDLATERLRRLAPGLGVGHGQMAAGDLKQWCGLLRRASGYIACTTIVKAVWILPVPIQSSKSTVCMADHQLRGRVGRAGRKAVPAPAASDSPAA